MLFAKSVAGGDVHMRGLKYEFMEESFDLVNNENESMKREIAIVKPIQAGTTFRFDTGTG